MLYQARPEGIEYRVEHAFEPREDGEVDGGCRGVGIHTHGGGVDDDFGVAKRADVVVVHFSAARHDGHGSRAFAFCERACGVGSAAASEYDDVFFRKGYACVPHGEEHPERVGIVSDESAAAVNDGVHRAAFARREVQLVHQRNHVALVGNGHVDPVEAAFCEKSRKIGRFQRTQCVVRRAVGGMQTRREAVAERVPDQSESH